MVDLRVAEWRAKFSNLQGGKEIVSLTGETTADLRLLEKGDLIVCTPSQVSVSSWLSICADDILVGRTVAALESAQERTEHRALDRRRGPAYRRRHWAHI